MEDITGKQFGSYRIVSRFGEGGMATVYKAYQPSMDRYVALKVLPRFHSSDPEFLGRFEQEAKALAQLQHTHILPIYDFGESEGYTYFVMPLMHDGNLAELMAKERLPLPRIHQIISQVGSALDFAHMRGFIHRDVKPSNILLDESGNCILMDFGIAKIIEGSMEFTRTGGILGTPVYMSPEQGSGQKIDHKTDIYALGVILYEMATGRPPFEADTPVAIIFKHVHDPLPPPSSLNPDIPEEFERVILKSLAKQPQDRYATAREMVDALSRAVIASQRPAIELPETERDPLTERKRTVPERPDRVPEAEEAAIIVQPERVAISAEPRGKPRRLSTPLLLVGAVAIVAVAVWVATSGILDSGGNGTAGAEMTEIADAAAEAVSGVFPSQTVEASATTSPTDTLRPTSLPSPTVLPSPTPPYVPVPTSEAVGSGYENNSFLGFNLEVHPFDDVRVREAIATAIDRESIATFLESLMDWRGYIPATSMVPRDILGFDLYGEVGHSYELDRARMLMAEAGYPNGEGFPTIAIAHFPTDPSQQIAIRLAEMLNETLGINVTTLWLNNPDEVWTNTPGLFSHAWVVDQSIEPHVWLHTLVCGVYDYDFYVSSEYAVLDAALQATQDWPARRELIIEITNSACQGQWDPHTHWNSPEYERLLGAALSEPNAEARRLLYVEAERLLVESDVVFIPLGHFKIK
jgi:serine/threonine protein kinase